MTKLYHLIGFHCVNIILQKYLIGKILGGSDKDDKKGESKSDEDDPVEVSDEKPGSDEEGGNRRKRKKRDVNDESDSESTMEDSDLQQV